MLRIITDSAADITLAQAEKMNIDIVPIGIQFPDGPCPQESNEDFASFYKRLESAESLPVTSQPAPELYMELIEKARAAGDTVLILTLSGGLSGTVNAAHIAREMCGYEPVYVFDTGLAITAQRILVEQAVRLRDEGADIGQILSSLDELKGRITVYGLIDTLKYLRRGGRIPASLAAIGSTLNIKPIIILRDRTLGVIGKAMGRKIGRKIVMQHFGKNPPDPDYPIYFVYSSNREMCEQFKQETMEQFDLRGFSTDTYPAGGVIGTHLGPDCVGISYVVKA